MLKNRIQIAVLVALLVVVATVGAPLSLDTDASVDSREATTTGGENPRVDGQERSAYEVPLATEQTLSRDRHGETLRLVRYSRVPAGGFGPAPPRQPSLYSTYHAVTSAEHLEMDIPNENATAKWIRTSYDTNFTGTDSFTYSSTETKLSLRDYYYSVVALNEMNSTVNDRFRLRATIENFRASDGGYCDQIYRENRTCVGQSSLASTYYGVRVVDELGGTVDAGPRNWLQQYWLNDSNFRDSGDLLSMAKLTEGLRAAGTPVFTLSKYEQRRQWVTNETTKTERRIRSDGNRKVPLLMVGAYATVTTVFDVETTVSDSELSRRIEARQLPAGGFSLVGTTQPDMKGTSVALAVAAGGDETLALPQTKAYLTANSLTSGGFAPSFRTQPTLKSTYYATRLLALSGVDVSNDEALVRWIESTDTEDRPLSQLYYAASLSRLTGASGPSNERIQNRLDRFFSDRVSRSRPVQLYYAVELAKMSSFEHNNSELRNQVLQLQQEDGGFGADGSRTDTTLYSVLVLERTGGVPEDVRESVLAWVERQRQPHSGFRFKTAEAHRQRADVLSTFASVAIKHELNASVAHSDDVRQFLESTKHPDGGYAVVPDSAPGRQSVSIVNSYYAMKTLELLDSSERSGAESPLRTIGSRE